MKATTMIATIVLALAALALVAVPAADAAEGDTFVSGGLTYQVDSEDAVSVVGTDKAVARLIIPETVANDGVTYNVTKIADKAFMGSANMKTADLGAVYSIGMKAFANCYALTEVVGENVSIIGAYAFYDDSKLCVVDFEGQARGAIGAGAFTKCTAVNQLTLPSNLVRVEDNAFSAFRFVDGDGNVIDKTADALKGKAYIGSAKKLVQVDFAANRLGYRLLPDYSYPALEVCACLPGITKVVVLEPFEVDDDLVDVVSVADGLFKGMTSITYADLGTVEKVGDYAFYGCTGLTGVSMLCVKSIGFKAFANCSSLASDTPSTYTYAISKIVPASPSDPDGFWFGCCFVKVKTTSGTHVVRTVSFGAEGIEEVGAYAFYGCTAATTIDLSPGATVGAHAFAHSNIKVVHTEW